MARFDEHSIAAEEIGGVTRSKGYRATPITNFENAGVPDPSKEDAYKKQAANAGVRAKDAERAAKAYDDEFDWEPVVAGVTSAFAKGVEIADSEITRNLAQEVQENVQAAEEDFFGITSISTAQAFSQAPEGLKAGLKDLEGASMAAKAGRLGNPSHFYAKLHARKRELQAKWPGWADQIDSFSTEFSGVDSGKALRDAMISEAKAARAAMDATSKANLKLVTDLAKAGTLKTITGLEADALFDGLQEGRIDTADVLTKMDKYNSIEADLKLAQTRAKMTELSHQTKQEELARAYNKRIDFQIDNTNEAAIRSELPEASKLSVGELREEMGKVLQQSLNDPDAYKQLSQLAVVLSGQRAMTRERIRSTITQESPGVFSNDQLKAFMDRASAPYDSMISSIHNKDASIFTASATQREWDSLLLTDQVREALGPESSVREQLVKIHGEKVGAAMHHRMLILQDKTLDGWQLAQAETAMRISLALGSSGNGIAKHLAPSVQDPEMRARAQAAFESKSRIHGNKRKEVGREFPIANTAQMYVDTAVEFNKPELTLQAIHTLMGKSEDDTAYYTHLTPKEKASILDVFANDKGVIALQKAYSVDPARVSDFVGWQNKMWAANSKKYIDEATNIQAYRDQVSLAWDPDKGEFKLVPIEVSREAANSTKVAKIWADFKFNLEKNAVEIARRDIGVLNSKISQQLKLLNIVSKDPNTAMFETLQAVGYQPGAPHRGGFLTMMQEAMNGWIEESNAKVDEDQKRQQSKDTENEPNP